MDQCIRGDPVERQSASWPVQIDCYSATVRGEDTTYVCCSLIVTDRVTSTRTEETPGPVVLAKTTFIILSFSFDSSVCHPYINPSFPLHLPVTGAAQTLPTENLLPRVKSIWVVRVRLLFFHFCHPSVVLRQTQHPVCCVWVQCDFTGI